MTTKPALHPWLSSPDAVKAAYRAAKIPARKMPAAAHAAGPDELLSEAFAILTECAMPSPAAGRVCAECGAPLNLVRSGAKFCGAKCLTRNKVRRHRRGGGELPAAVPKSHIGSMHSWPEDQMLAYAVSEVGLALCNYLRTRPGRSEVSSSQWMDRADVPARVPELGAREVIEDYLTACGVGFDGTETLQELAEAARHILGLYFALGADEAA